MIEVMVGVFLGHLIFSLFVGVLRTVIVRRSNRVTSE